MMFALLMLGFQVYSYVGIDEETIRSTASGGAPARFIQADEEELMVLQERLKALKAFPDEVLTEPKAEEFGRSTLFLPDEGRERRRR